LNQECNTSKWIEIIANKPNGNFEQVLPQIIKKEQAW